MNPRKRAVTLAFCAHLALLPLPGCGSGSDSSGGAGTITLDLALWDENLSEVIRQSLESYKKDHPNVNVRVTYTPFADYWSKLRTSLAGKSGPDVFWMNGPNFYQYVSANLLKELDPLMAADGIKKEDYTKTLVDMYSTEGKLYGLPYFLDDIALYYNKELFDEAGIPYPDETWDWDKLKETGAKLTRKDKGQYGYISPVTNQDGYYNLIHQAGGYIINDDKTKSGFDLPESIAALNWLKQLSDEGISPDARQQLETEPVQMFGSGKAAMVQAISVKAPELHGMLGDKLGIAPLPGGKRKATIVHGLSWAVNRNTEHEQAAWDLVKALAGEHGSTLLAKSGFSIPAYEKAQAEWLKSIPSLNLQVFVDSIENAAPYPVSKYTAEWQTVETKEILEALRGRKSVEEAAGRIASKMNILLEKEQGVAK
ncbi:sugar ABC transporter substrate-binding protein [Paenibacillus sp. UNC499MF]|uniref:ABC transporter substrate-binding protein n=1 Tax=Paenibacillus sp. UNC499MF TaxID=1502751 RepID=UPI00089FD00E|nr:sugar ABC transporter substrate-binding protein [Paenibacillus sp. UNC499MF]SEG43624.1 multiple sugar transport system substrate-binding protein [Paenibacillus sp. UNC499MF]